jgi:hypothetical protein
MEIIVAFQKPLEKKHVLAVATAMHPYRIQPSSNTYRYRSNKYDKHYYHLATYDSL